MPYAYEEPMFPVVSKQTTIPMETIREYQEALAKMRLEKEALEDKCLKTDFENVKLKKQVKDHEKRSTFKMDGSWRKMRRFVERMTRSRNTSNKEKKLEELTNANPAPDEQK